MKVLIQMCQVKANLCILKKINPYCTNPIIQMLQVIANLCALKEVQALLDESNYAESTRKQIEELSEATKDIKELKRLGQEDLAEEVLQKMQEKKISSSNLTSEEYIINYIIR